MSRKQKILILEDDDSTQKIYSAIFSKSNEFDFVICKNDSEFYKALDEHHFDLFVIDLELGPGKDGIEIIRDLRLMEKYNTAPIVVVTAHALMKDEYEAKSAGATIFIRKPCSNNRLQEEIKNLITCNSF